MSIPETGVMGAFGGSTLVREQEAELARGRQELQHVAAISGGVVVTNPVAASRKINDLTREIQEELTGGPSTPQQG